MNYGFVYILVNDYMPDTYKVGCTERSPHARAEELSKHTGVPAPFKVACHIEVVDFQQAERLFHGWLKQYRISESREFFFEGLEFAVRLLYWYPKRISFTEPENPHGGVSVLFDCLCGGEDWITDLSKSHDPWATEVEVDQSKVGGFDIEEERKHLRLVDGGVVDAA